MLRQFAGDDEAAADTATPQQQMRYSGRPACAAPPKVVPRPALTPAASSASSENPRGDATNIETDDNNIKFSIIALRLCDAILLVT